MASPKTPAQQQHIQLTDPHNVHEVYANNLAGIQVRDGMAHVTLSIVRPRHTSPGTAANDENAVAIRYVTPLAVVNALLSAFQQIALAQSQQPPSKAN